MNLVCGVDEAGRGPIAGPVYAAAVILDPARRVNGLADSKVLTAERREVLAGRIKERAVAWAVAHASVEEIDRINILRASLLAMRRAVESLKIKPSEAWIDGNMCPDLPCAARAIVDGDATHKPISAASILAKTARDAEMCALHDRFPQYGFDQHKGYATPEHLDAVGRLGPSAVHRRSFRSVAIFSQGNLFSMEEALRVRGYRLYCEAMKVSGLKRLDEFDERARRLRREYADVFASQQALPHVDMVKNLLREARAQCKEKTRS
jgi:ribonuclease HII